MNSNTKTTVNTTGFTFPNPTEIRQTRTMQSHFSPVIEKILQTFSYLLLKQTNFPVILVPRQLNLPTPWMDIPKSIRDKIQITVLRTLTESGWSATFEESTPGGLFSIGGPLDYATSPTEVNESDERQIRKELDPLDPIESEMEDIKNGLLKTLEDAFPGVSFILV